MTRKIIFALLLSMQFAACSSRAHGEPIVTSALSPYNAFVFGDYDATISDVEGNAAIGGDLTSIDYSFGFQLNPAQAAGSDVLVLGGNADLTRTRVYHGDFVHAGTNSLTNTGVDGVIRNESPVDFPAEKQRYTAFSKRLSMLSPTGTASSQFNKLTLSGANADLNVFLVTPDLWVDATGGDVTVIDLDIPDGATALVNVAGAVPEISALGFDDVVGGQPSPYRRSTLFNMFEADAVTTTNIGLEGALLAPLANLIHNDAVIYGQVIAGAFEGTGQVDLEPFDGQLPFPVPEPEGNGLFVIAVLGLMVLRRGRRFGMGKANTKYQIPNDK